MIGTVEQTLTERVFNISTIQARMDRWVSYAKSQNIELNHILAHPSDWQNEWDFDFTYKGLPVKPLGGWGQWA